MPERRELAVCGLLLLPFFAVSAEADAPALSGHCNFGLLWGSRSCHTENTLKLPDLVCGAVCDGSLAKTRPVGGGMMAEKTFPATQVTTHKEIRDGGFSQVQSELQLNQHLNLLFWKYPVF